MRVPQDSAMAPFLILIYVKDFVDKVQVNTICQFSDDTSCIVSGRNQKKKNRRYGI